MVSWIDYTFRGYAFNMSFTVLKKENIFKILMLITALRRNLSEGQGPNLLSN